MLVSRPLRAELGFRTSPLPGSQGRALRLPVRASSSAGANRPSLPAMDPVERTRRTMGYKNNWHRKEVDESAQHVWKHSMPSNPKVAIIGAGLSGLVCAKELAKMGIQSVLFDTGKHSTGGRLATRALQDRSLRASVPAALQGSELAFDHAAQFFTATDPRFKSIVDSWAQAGAVKQWHGPVGTLHAAGAGPASKFTPFAPEAPARWVGTKGMRMLAKALEEDLVKQHPNLVEVRRPVWVGKMQAHGPAGGWQLQGEGRDQGVYDFVVISHNGKCANRLVGPTGAPLVAKQLMGLRLSAVWVTMVAFAGSVPAPFEGAFVSGNDVLTWAGNNTAKLGLNGGPAGVECWTLVSSNAYGQANKVPQEAIPPDVADKVAKEMVDALAHSLGLPGRSALPPMAFFKCQLWGAALPLNTPSVEAVVDPHSRVGICGDWLLGGSMQAAAVSGAVLAQRIAGLRGVPMANVGAHELGLRAPFKPLQAADLGEFPGLPAPKAVAPARGSGSARPGGQQRGQDQQRRPGSQGGPRDGAGPRGQGQGQGQGRPAGQGQGQGRPAGQGLGQQLQRPQQPAGTGTQGPRR